MTCDLCGKNEAAVHLTEIINDQTRELHLCEACAHEKGSAAAEQFGLAGLLAGLTEAGIKGGLRSGENPRCARCGMTYQDFRKNGRLGCGACYESFHKYLAPLLKRLHGSAQYAGALSPSGAGKPAPAAGAAAGKKRKPAGSLAQLKEQLKEAVAAERFEEAARLRDKIRAAGKKKKPAKARAIAARKKPAPRRKAGRPT